MKTVRLKYFFLLFISFLAVGASAQDKGKISGKVIDKKTGEELIGVSVQIEGTSIGAVTDFEGVFAINNVTPGTYNLIVSYISYQRKIISQVTVKAKETTIVNTTLEESTKTLNEVVVSAELKRETASALLIQQKKNVSISDGVSADLIKKTPDATTGDVMKRISGTSIQDNKFAIIRGLNDRYNTAYINGAPLPSTESDRKAFSFDIFPSNMLDNMVITKTASPELPGDFAGGMITINTKDIPEKTFVSASFGSSIHSITTFNQSYENTPGSTNFLGVDNGTRALPSGIPERLIYEASSSESKFEASKKFNDQWSMNEISSTPMNNSFQVSGGTNFKFKEKQQAGFIISLSRSKSYKTTPAERNKFLKNLTTEDNQLLQQYEDTVYKQEVLTGLMFNAGWKLGNNHKISFKNAYTVNTEDQTVTRGGHDDLTDQTGIPLVSNRYFIYQDNRLMSNQLIGEHYISAVKLKAKWVLNNNDIHRKMPDFKRASSRSTIKNAETGEYYDYNTELSNSIDITQTGRFYQDLKENIKSAGVDLQKPIDVLSGKKVKTELKLGGFYQIRQRDFQVRAFGYKLMQVNNPGSPYFRPKFIAQSQDVLFSEENLAQDTFYIDERINPQDVYTAESRLSSAYAMFDQRLYSRFRVAYGVRMESYNQKLHSLGNTGLPVEVDTTFTDFLPSANLTYELTEKINLRLSGSQTLARPEFRELAPFSFYDFNYNTVVAGNPALGRTKISNFDFRFELYPGESQLVSFSLFYKDFKNAIEQVYENVGATQLGYSSNTNASNYGFEVELRKNFDFLDRAFGTNWIRKFSVTMNYAYIRSEVKFDNSISSTNQSFGTRPLQGQSPYIVNGSFQFYDPKSTLSAAVFVNRVGRRIAFVREKNGQVPDLWENPRTVIDLSIAKTFYKHYEFKFGVNDILAQDLIFYQDNNNNGKYDNISTNVNAKNGATPRLDPNIPVSEKSQYDNPVFKYKMGYTISMGIGVKF